MLFCTITILRIVWLLIRVLWYIRKNHNFRREKKCTREKGLTFKRLCVFLVFLRVYVVRIYMYIYIYVCIHIYIYKMYICISINKISVDFSFFFLLCSFLFFHHGQQQRRAKRIKTISLCIILCIEEKRVTNYFLQQTKIYLM